MDRKKKIGVSAAIAVVLVAVVLIVPLLVRKNTSDANEEAIQAVAYNIFTGPDDEMIQLYDEMVKEAGQKAAPGKATGLDSAKIKEKLDETYSGYISEAWYASFLDKFYNRFMVYSIASDYEINVRNMDIAQDKNSPGNYSFTVYLNYGPEGGSKADAEIKGSAQFAEEGKLSYIRFFDDDLYKEIRSSL